MEEEGQGAVPPAPKIIHFVWAGGMRPMPDKSISIVIEWLINNPDFTVYLWVDEKTWGDAGVKVNYYLERARIIFAKNKSHLKESECVLTDVIVYEEEENTKRLLKETQGLIPGKIIIKDLNRNGLRDKWIAYFIELIRPNYGMSSDLVRELCLFEFGGAYFDTDVRPGSTRLRDLSIFKKSGNHRVLVDDFTQKQRLVSKQLNAVFSLENAELKQLVGNDVFASTTHNPLMKLFFDFSIHRLIDLCKSKTGKFAFCYGSLDIKYLSVFVTGPKAIRDCISFYEPTAHNRPPRGGMDLVVISNEKEIRAPVRTVVEIDPIRAEGVTPIESLAPTHNWLKAQRHEYSSLQMLKDAVRDAILFEAGYFNIVRVDDHIVDLVELSQGFDEKLDETKALTFILSIIALQNPQIARRFLLKVTGKFASSVAQLSHALPTTAVHVKQMISCLSYWGEPYGLFVQEQQIEMGSNYLTALEDHFRTENAPPPSLFAILTNICASMDAFEIYCKPRIAFLDASLERELKGLISLYLQKYLKFIEGVLAVTPRWVFEGVEKEDPESLKIKATMLLGGLGIKLIPSAEGSRRFGKK